MKRLVIFLILLDAALTYVAVGHLGARELVLTFVNQVPSLIWLVALAKVLAVLYLVENMKKYAWIEYILHLVVFIHSVVVINNTYWLLLRLFGIR